MRAIERAVAIAGGQTALARRCQEVSGHPYRQSHIWNWLNEMEAVPPDVAVLLEKATGVDRSEFRPDLWPRARWKAVKRAVRG